MSMGMIRSLVSKIPKCSLKGIAYISAANFLARAAILIRHYIVNYFHSEMVLIYGANLDTRILLFFQSIYMIPMFILGVLVFYGIERESFNLVLYPTLMLLFLILIRYGSEAALLVTHWEDHKLDQTPELLFSLLQDVLFITLLFLYVYCCLAFTPIKPTPLELIEGGSASSNQAEGFNYALRRNIGQVPKDSQKDLEELQKQRNSLLVKEGPSLTPASFPTASVVIETDLDAVVVPPPPAKVSPRIQAPAREPTPTSVPVLEPTPVPTPAPEPVPEAAVPVVPEPEPEPPAPVVPAPAPVLTKSRVRQARKLAAAKSLSTESAPKEPEKPAGEAEPSEDFWASMNGGTGETTKTGEGFKTTSV